MINVFIVEDDPMVLEVNCGFLDRMSHFSLSGSATNGREAVAQITKARPDLVLLDMYLPDQSGLEVLKAIRAAQVPSDVIMISAARDAKTIHEFFRLGAVDYLVKPFRFERFKSALEAYQKMWRKLNQNSMLKQEDIDELKSVEIATEQLPKGLSEATLRQIFRGLLDQSKPVTAEQFAASLGMARVTVRRYLDYLEQSGKVKVTIQYGSVGRPSHYYYL